MEPLKLALRAVVLRVARLLGSPVVDLRTGQVLGRALLVPFRGRIHVVGLDAAVRPVFAPQDPFDVLETGTRVHRPPTAGFSP